MCFIHFHLKIEYMPFFLEQPFLFVRQALGSKNVKNVFCKFFSQPKVSFPKKW